MIMRVSTILRIPMIIITTQNRDAQSSYVCVYHHYNPHYDYSHDVYDQE